MFTTEFGILLRLETGRNLTGYTVQLVIERPDGSTILRTPTIVPGTSGTAEYVTQEGDMGAGFNRLQMIATKGTTERLVSLIFDHYVTASLAVPVPAP